MWGLAWWVLLLFLFRLWLLSSLSLPSILSYFSFQRVCGRERGVGVFVLVIADGGGAGWSGSGSFGPGADGTLPFVALSNHPSPPQTHRGWSQRSHPPQMGQIHDDCKSPLLSLLLFSPILLLYGCIGPNLHHSGHGARPFKLPLAQLSLCLGFFFPVKFGVWTSSYRCYVLKHWFDANRSLLLSH